MSTSETESYNNTFTLPIDSFRAYIYSKGYFSKALLPYNPAEKKRFVEIKCLLPNINGITCDKTWKVYYKYLTTSNQHSHLKKYHPTMPRSKEEEEKINSFTLEGK